MVIPAAIGVTGGVVLAAAQFLIAQATEANTLQFSPVSDQIHEKAADLNISNRKARLYQTLNYFGRPVDRLIQAAVAPFFMVKRYIASIIKVRDIYQQTQRLDPSYTERKRDYLIKAGFAVVGFPIMLTLGLLTSVGSIIRAAGELVFPLMTVTFIVGGQQGAALFGWAKQSLWEQNKASMFCARPAGIYQIDYPKSIASIIV